MNKGAKNSIETRRKISEAQLGPKNHFFGKQLTEEHRKKISLALKGRMPKFIPDNKGCVGSWKGKKRPDFSGPNHPFWKGGKARKAWNVNKRRLRKTMNGGGHTLGEWEKLKAQYNWTCPCCKRREPNIKLTIDHIVAVSLGGSDNIENIQPLCRPCNSRKQTKNIKYENSSLYHASL